MFWIIKIATEKIKISEIKIIDLVFDFLVSDFEFVAKFFDLKSKLKSSGKDKFFLFSTCNSRFNLMQKYAVKIPVKTEKSER